MKIKYLVVKTPTGIIIQVPLSSLEAFEIDVLNGWRLSIVEKMEK